MNVDIQRSKGRFGISRAVITGTFLIVIFLIPALFWNQGLPGSIASAQGPTPYGQRGYWDLIFSEDFDTRTIDPNKWTSCYWWVNHGCTNEGNQELQWYQPRNVLTANGTLYLVASHETVSASNGKIYRYTSGMVTTDRDTPITSIPPRFALKYGYVEVRARVPKGQGLWPAIWLLPTDHTSIPEVDAMEVRGDQPSTIYMNLHYGNPDGSTGTAPGQWTMPEDPSSDWHTYAVDWKPDGVTWYIDGIERHRVTDRNQIPTSPLYLVMNLAVGGEWPGSPGNSTAFPGAFEIDYVRVWKQGARQIISPMADTYVDASYNAANYGHERSLQIDDIPKETTYLKYDLRSFAGKQLQSAWLRVKTTTDPYSGSVNSQTFHLVPQDNWGEENITAQDQPPFSPESIGLLAETQPDVIYDIPLDSTVVQNHLGTIFSIAITTNGADGLSIFSREALSVGPRLLINLK